MSETGSILLRRGPTTDRLAFVPLDGEIIYDSDLKKVYVGDGEIYGGNSVTFGGNTRNVYYVTSEGKDNDISHDGTSIDRAFATIRKACDVAGAGIQNLNAVALITVNKTWLVTEMLQFMLYQKANSLNGFTPNSVFDQQDVVADATTLINAVIYDMSRDGNFRTVATTLAYFKQDANNTFYDQPTATAMPFIIVGLTYLRNIMLSTLANTAPAVNYQNLMNVGPIAQVFDFTKPAESTAGPYVTNLFAITLSALAAQSTTNVPKAVTGVNASIYIKTGTYKEILPITVPENTALLGDSIRNTFVQPKTGLSSDGVTANNVSTMFLVSDGALIKNITFTGMTGFVPNNAYPTNINTATIGGKFVAFNPQSPIINKSPYVIECSTFGPGGIAAVVDGSVHKSGNKSMVFHGYTINNDNGIGLWIKDAGRAEVVSCFTYFCYMGYVATGGGLIRSLNGNNSYGTYGAVSFGNDASETTVTGALYGNQIIYDQDFSVGTLAIGNTVTGTTSGATGTVLSIVSVYDKIHYKAISGTFVAGETVTNGAGASVKIAPAGVSGQFGFTLYVNNLTPVPLAGGSIEFVNGDNGTYVIQSVSGYDSATGQAIIVLANEKPTPNADGSGIRIRYRYSTCRITGHDFLSIGTGGVTSTNYPFVPLTPASQGNEIHEEATGRVYYISTDQDGNFRVGNYFRINQSTGVATLNTSAFDLSGLNTLNVAAFGGIVGETINEFSSDPSLSGDSNLAVPTEFAVRNYFTQISTNVIPATTNTYNLGSASKKWNDLYVNTINGTTLNVTSLNLGSSLIFEGATADAFETTLQVTDPTADRTLILPDVSGNIVTTGDTGSVTNAMLAGSIANAKLTNNTISGKALGANLDALTIGTGLSGTSYNGSSVVTIAIDTATTVDKTTAQTLTNKSLSDSTTSFIDEGDTTKKMQFQLSGIATATTRTLTIPNVDGTIVTTGDTGSVTNAMLAGSIANAKLVNSSVTINGQAVSLGGQLTVSAAAPNNLNIGTGLTGTSIDQQGATFTNTAYSGAAAVTITVDSTVTTNSGTQTLTNKSLSDSTTSFIDEGDATRKMQFQLSGISTGTTRTLSIPNVNGIIITTGDSATVTNAMLSGSIANDKLAGSIANSKLVNSSVIIGSTTVNLGDTITALAGITTIGTSGNVTIGGTLTVNGTTTTINSTTLTVDDKNIELGSIALPTDATANGGGITLRGDTDHNIIWDNTNSNWSSSEHWNIASSKTFKINNTTVLSSTQVLGKTIGGTGAGDIVDLDTTQTLTNKALGAGCTFPILNQNTSGTATLATNLVGGNNTTLLGSIPYQSGVNTTVLLAPNTTATKKFLRLTGNGTNGAAPAWDTVTATDVGLGNVTNESKATMFSSPTFTGTVSGVTATHVGLGNVTNESKATMFASPTFTGTVSGVTATHVGLGNVTNESKATMFASPTFTGTVTTTAITTGAATTAGTITGNWSLTGKWQATYADLAENYEADADYAPGTVVELGGEKEVTLAEDSTCRVAGVVSTNPAYLLNKECAGKHVVAIALQGRVPVKVRGRVRKGDFLISGGNGFARPSATPVYGSVIGKAIENFDGGEGIIEIMIGRM